jgi:HAD superfamily hydrolase (TIGR01549 family)
VTERPEVVLFDMDGTLTLPNHDFRAIKADMGLPPNIMILEELERIEGEAPQRARELRAILERHEARAAESAEPRAGAREVVKALHDTGIRTGLITRNARRFVRLTLRRIGLTFDVVVAREDAPPKPSPEPLHRACRELGTTAARAWMVGDYKYDIEAGRAAGCAATILLLDPGHRPFEHEATFVIQELGELLALVGGARDP